jgi:superfamily II DNA or RNA helicase
MLTQTKTNIPNLIWKNGKTILSSSSERHRITPYPYQEDAWKDMDKYFVEDAKKAGIVWIPTGGGKTVIAVQMIVSKKYILL